MTLCSSWLRDDLTNINPNLISMNENNVLAYISPSRFSEIKKDMIADKIKLTPENKQILEKVSELDNPVIVILTLNKKPLF
jgi:2-hydroxy-3-keto-5-methylthiopentenyl-1-phosphate phosphatase